MSYYNYTDPNQATDDLDIDLSTVEEAAPFEPVPPGDYVMQSVGAEATYSKAGNRMIKVQFQILGGTHDNRRIFEQFNVGHTNPTVVQIAQRDLKAWVMACGYTGNERLTMGMLHDLEGREFIGAVKVDKDKTGQYQDSNRIRAYKPLPGAVAPAHAPPVHTQAPAPAAAAVQPTPPQAAHMPPPQAQPAAGGASKRPWER